MLLGLALPAEARHKRTTHHRRHAHRVHHRVRRVGPPIAIPVAPDGYDTVLRGGASWYGKVLQGHHTASGERYDRFQFTCAHRTLPFGTRLRVTNVDNGLTVVVRVSDRGPFHHQRVLDLSQQAASSLSMVRAGAADIVAVIVPEETPLGDAETPANLAALRAADPHPQAPCTAYLLASSARPTPVVEQAEHPADQLAVAAAALELDSQFVVQAGLFPDARQAAAALARIQSFAPGLTGQLETSVLAGQPVHRVVFDRLNSWLAAETVRRSLQAHGIQGQVLTRLVPLPSPALSDIASAKEPVAAAQ